MLSASPEGKRPALPYPPVAPAFLELFGAGARVEWLNEPIGLFVVVVPRSDAPAEAAGDTTVPAATAGWWMPAAQVVVETPSVLEEPVIDPAQRCRDPPLCLHGRPTVARVVSRRDSVNIGRTFYACTWPEGRRCGFFRWQDELSQFSEMVPRAALTAADVRRETAAVDPVLQLSAWEGVKQGTDTWHALRACRVTASNFGSANRTNSYQTPTDLLRSLLWPMSFDSAAMRYGPARGRPVRGGRPRAASAA